MTGVWKRPEASRALLAFLFSAAFLANGGLALYVNLTGPQPHVNGLSVAVVVFGLIALAGGVQQLLKLRTAP